MRVLEKAGFKREGRARRYLKINGVAGPRSLRPAARRSRSAEGGEGLDAQTPRQSRSLRVARGPWRAGAARAGDARGLPSAGPVRPPQPPLKAIDDHQRRRPPRHLRARRGLRAAATSIADRDRAGRRRHHAAHVVRAHPRPAPIRPGSCSRCATPPTSRSSAGSRPTATTSAGSGVVLARPRRAAHRADHALRRLRARAHQERPRRRVPHHAGAGPDRHLRRRAGVRPLRAHLPVERRSSTSRRAATASSSTASCSASPACWPSS